MRFKPTSASALSSQLALISLILSVQTLLGQTGKVMGIIISSAAVSLLVYSLNIPKMTLRSASEPKFGIVISLASGWMYLVGVLVVQGMLAYAKRETILEPETIGNYAFFIAFFIYMVFLLIVLGITEKLWNLTQEDIGGGPVAAYAGIRHGGYFRNGVNNRYRIVRTPNK